jgi:hypothetical protein
MLESVNGVSGLESDYTACVARAEEDAMAMEGVARAAGFLGDGLTFVGSLFLAVDALFKHKEQATLSKRKLVAEDFPGSAETRGGQPMTVRSLEATAMAKSVHFAWVGAILLSLGFACLFISRLCEVGV